MQPPTWLRLLRDGQSQARGHVTFKSQVGQRRIVGQASLCLCRHHELFLVVANHGNFSVIFFTFLGGERSKNKIEIYLVGFKLPIHYKVGQTLSFLRFIHLASAA